MRRSRKKKFSIIGLYSTLIGLFVMLVGIFIVVVFIQERQEQRLRAAPAAELLTDKTNLSFTAGAYTAPYHLYAAGLDYSKPVGMLMFMDGTGESGFSKPTGNYQMGGPNG